jgi:hypothetical protein
MSNDDELAAEITAAGLRAEDRIWHMPIAEEYEDQLKSNFADFANTAGREGAPSRQPAFSRSSSTACAGHTSTSRCCLPGRRREGQHGSPGAAAGRLSRRPRAQLTRGYVAVVSTQVDFYLLSDSEPRAALKTACRLAEKAYDQGLKVVVRTDSSAATAQLDDLLWTFSDRSFVPHLHLARRPGARRCNAGAGRKLGGPGYASRRPDQPGAASGRRSAALRARARDRRGGR